MSYDPEQKSEKSIFGVIIHSFFVVPFLIAVFFVLLLAAVKILTAENQTVYDYLNDVKIGGLTKRWQSAFKLAQHLSQNNSSLHEERLEEELIRVFNQSKDDDPRVRQYLALAMARLGKDKFVLPLLNALKDEKEENIYSFIYALGVLKAANAVPVISTFVDHPTAKIRSGAVAALGTIGDPQSIIFLKKALNDSEPNVEWLAAISLALMNNDSGKGVLIKLLTREYFLEFPELDPQEQNDLMLITIEAASHLKDSQLNAMIRNLAKTDKNMDIRKLAMGKANASLKVQ